MAVYKNGVLVPVAPAAHEDTHVSGGSDDIDSALADAAIPSLATSKITSTRFPIDRLPAMTDEKIWKGTGANVEEIDVPSATKEFFIPATSGKERVPTGEEVGYLIDATNDDAFTAFYVPDDFTSIIEAVLIIRPLASATHRLDLNAHYGANGENYATNNEDDADVDTVMVSGTLIEIDISGILTALAIGDHVKIWAKGDAVNTPNLVVRGVRFKYS